MSENSRPEFHPSSPEAAIERLIQSHNDRINDCENMVRDYEMEASVLREVNDALVNILNPPKPEGITSSLAGLTRAAASLPVYSKGYTSMQAQAANHAAQVRPMKDNPQA